MIYLLAGHHDRDPGAIGNGYKESDLTKDVRDLVAERLRSLSPDTKLWLDDDSDTLIQVITKVRPNIKDTDILVDFHFDAFTNPNASGSTALVSANSGAKSKQLGADLVGMASMVLDIPNRGVKDESQSARGRLSILNMRGAAVLLEIAFISNPDDMVNYFKNNHSTRYWLCDEIARILIKHV